MKCSFMLHFLLIFLFTVVVYAQDNLQLTIKSENFNSTGIPTEALLYDQRTPAGTNGSPSQFFGDFGGAGESADDFVVPAGLVWTIDSVFVVGSFNAGNGANFQSVSVKFYSNNSNLPGSIVDQRLGIVPLAPGPQYGVALNPPVVLPEGTYWLNFMVNMNYNPGASQFFWSQTSGAQIGSFRAFRDSTNLFGTGQFANWQTAQGSGIGGGVEPDLRFALFGTSGVIPVELTSFSASSVGTDVHLNWVTASEVNNHGFEIQRNSGSGFATVAFVQGNGTTTEVKNYSFIDKNLTAGNYSYRLKQLDYNGMYEYSSNVEVDVTGLTDFVLIQNYPNPFNPTTMISFNLVVDSKVTLKIYNLLGQEVSTLLNQNLTAGLHEVNFDATGLNSGIYFYQLEALGIDGKTFSSVKKMILSK